jgi:hypothetical protein
MAVFRLFVAGEEVGVRDGDALAGATERAAEGEVDVVVGGRSFFEDDDGRGDQAEVLLDGPKTHFLDLLLTALITHHPMLWSLRRGLLFLTVFAVDTRYPGKSASKRQAVAALRWAERVRTRARARLGIRERPRRR